MTGEDPIIFHMSEMHFRAALLLAAAGAVVYVLDGGFKDAAEGRRSIEAAVENILIIERDRLKERSN